MTHPRTDPCPAAQPIPGRADPGVSLSIWPDLPAPRGGAGPWPCAGPVTGGATAAVIAVVSVPGGLIAAGDGSRAVTGAGEGTGRRVLALAPTDDARARSAASAVRAARSRSRAALRHRIPLAGLGLTRWRSCGLDRRPGAERASAWRTDSRRHAPHPPAATAPRNRRKEAASGRRAG